MKLSVSHRLLGFTVIELLACLSIIAVLAVVATPALQLSYQRSKELALREALRDIRYAIDAYKKATDEGKIAKLANESGYPRTLDDLAAPNRDANQPSEDALPLRFIRRIPRDPMSTDTAVAHSKTWGLRSYRSSDTDPKPGEDVYDVFSLSTGTGLNGIAYRQW
jgi:general secretion pathway protein G